VQENVKKLLPRDGDGMDERCNKNDETKAMIARRQETRYDNGQGVPGYKERAQETEESTDVRDIPRKERPRNCCSEEKHVAEAKERIGRVGTALERRISLRPRIVLIEVGAGAARSSETSNVATIATVVVTSTVLACTPRIAALTTLTPRCSR
jgi:hypothetical protein